MQSAFLRLPRQDLRGETPYSKPFSDSLNLPDVFLTQTKKVKRVSFALRCHSPIASLDSDKITHPDRNSSLARARRAPNLFEDDWSRGELEGVYEAYSGAEALEVYEIPYDKQADFLNLIREGEVLKFTPRLTNLFSTSLSLLLNPAKYSPYLMVHEIGAFHSLQDEIVILFKELHKMIQDPIYLAREEDQITIIISKEQLTRIIPENIGPILSRFIVFLGTQFFLGNQEQLKEEGGFSFRCLPSDTDKNYYFFSFSILPNSFCTQEFNLTDAPEMFGIEEIDTDSWLQSVGETETVLMIPRGRRLDDSFAIDIAQDLLQKTLVGKDADKKGTEIPDYVPLVANIVERLQAIKEGVEGEPIYLSVIRNEIRITTTQIGQLATLDLLDSSSQEAARFFNEMPERYREFNPLGSTESEWSQFDNSDFRVTSIFVGSNVSVLKTAPKKRTSKTYLQNPATGERIELPRGYTVQIPKKNLTISSTTLRPTSLKGRTTHLAEVQKLETTFSIAFRAVYDVTK